VNLDFTEEQAMLRDTVRALCAEHCNLQTVRNLEASEDDFDADYWRALAAAGLCGLAIDEAYGGAGLGHQEAAVVAQEMGRALAPSPYVMSCLFSAGVLAAAGSEAQRQHWLPAIAGGESIVVPAWREDGRSEGFDAVQLEVVEHGDELLLSGSKTLVPFARSAQALLVLCRHRGALISALVPTAGVQCTRLPNHADQSLYRVDFDAVVLAADHLLTSTDTLAVWERSMHASLIAWAAQAVGGADYVLETTLAYASERQQFGQPIGAFQAIAHYLSDRATELEGARYQVYQAAWARDGGAEHAERLALMAKRFATAMYRQMTATGVQVHGGMGFSAEADLQLFYRRAKHQQLSAWSTRYLDQRIAAEVLA
jgi:alkylation response protein AidB-like acyl-CoA dehydrogenase